MTIILLPVQVSVQRRKLGTTTNALDTSFWVVESSLMEIPPKHRFKFRKPFIDVAGNILVVLEPVVGVIPFFEYGNENILENTPVDNHDTVVDKLRIVILTFPIRCWTTSPYRTSTIPSVLNAILTIIDINTDFQQSNCSFIFYRVYTDTVCRDRRSQAFR
jgi:hypothetical protein